MSTCAWCGATGNLHRTKVLADPNYDIDPIWLCLNRRDCRQRMTEHTEQQLTGAPR